MARAGAARLHAGDHDALVDLRHACHVSGRGDRLLDRSGLAAVVGHRPRPIENGVAGSFRPQLRRVGTDRVADVDDRLQRLVFDGDQFGRVQGRFAGLGDDRRRPARPTWSTRSPASAGRCVCTTLAPLRPVMGGWREILPTPAASMSAAVSTASTPGARRASATSTERMRAKACGERTNATEA